jgi:hypothetical protein
MLDKYYGEPDSA